MSVDDAIAWARRMGPGVLACAVVAAAASFLAEHHGGPLMLYALLLGMAMNFLSAAGGPCAQGIEIVARHVLRFGVALLGLRITLAQVAELGWPPIVIVVVSVVSTIAISMLIARWMGFQSVFGLLSGGAVAICGASAALALSAALPAHPMKERATLFTVVSVSALSTLVMILYPLLARAIDLPAHAAGVLFGATIHDVAQVVGAGYSVSAQAGDVATLVKLMRVAMLVPVIVFAVVFSRGRAAPGAAAGPKPPLLPWFAVAFAILVAINSSGLLPSAVPTFGSELSRWCLVTAIAGIGMKTKLEDLATVGFKPVLLMVFETVFLLMLVLALLRWGA